MLEWWFTHFPYHAISFPDGLVVSAYRLWHSLNHNEIKVKHHSLSGQLGMAMGARLELRERWGSEPRRTSLRVMRMDDSGLAMKIVLGPLLLGEVEETFEPNNQGTRCTSSLKTLPSRWGFRHALRSRHFSPAIVDTWVKHKVEEIGNFERFLPQLYAQTSIGRDATDLCAATDPINSR